MRLFLNTFPADHKYSHRKHPEIPSTNFNAITSKGKNLLLIFIAFLKCALNSEHLKNKDEYPSPIISEIIESERGGY